MAKSIRSVLISHAPPGQGGSPYDDLAKNHKLKIDFQPFVEFEGVSLNEFRKQKINPLDYSAVIFTGKNAIDHFFRLCTELRVEMPPDTKYFCVSQASAKYLQKYIVVRRRKLFVGEKSSQDLIALVKKHKDEQYLLPTSENARSSISSWMSENQYKLTIAQVYATCYTDLSFLKEKRYDLLCLFAPASLDSLLHQIPEFTQNPVPIAAFGKSTQEAVEEVGLEVAIRAPRPEAPSMSRAIELFLNGE